MGQHGALFGFDNEFILGAQYTADLLDGSQYYPAAGRCFTFTVRYEF